MSWWLAVAADPSTLDRIQKLLRLAQDNPSEHEASAAALKAARLMKEYGVEVGSLDWEQLRDEVLRTAQVVNPRQKAARRTAPPASRPAEGSYYAGIVNEDVIQTEVRKRVAAQVATHIAGWQIRTKKLEAEAEAMRQGLAIWKTRTETAELRAQTLQTQVEDKLSRPPEAQNWTPLGLALLAFLLVIAVIIYRLAS